MAAYPVLARPDMAPGRPRPQAERLPLPGSREKGSSPCPLLFPLAKPFRRRMTRAEHAAQSQFDKPPEYRFHDFAAGQPIFDPVGQPRPATEVFKFMAVDPAAKRSVKLLIDKEPVFLVAGVEGHPRNRSDPQIHTRP